jgi:RNA polymerase sigma-32 factor
MMADGQDELSLAEIGRRLGVSRERARQLEARAKQKIKRYLETCASELASVAA